MGSLKRRRARCQAAPSAWMAAVSPSSPSRSTAAGSKCTASATISHRQSWGTHSEPSPPAARGRHRYTHLVGHRAHAQPDDDAEHQRTPDHLNVIETPLQQEVRQQGVRTSASRAATSPNPQPFGARATNPPPIAAPSVQLASTIWTRVFAYLDLPPQREVGRDVQPARPYDGQGWYMHPN